jgi:hypothetical protein
VVTEQSRAGKAAQDPNHNRTNEIGLHRIPEQEVRQA